MMHLARPGCLVLALMAGLAALAQARGDASVRTKADAAFAEQRFNEALPLYAQLVSLTPGDHELNFRLGACVVESGEDKESAIGFLKYAVQNANIPPLAWYYLGRAYHVTYRFKLALDAYQHFRGMGDKKALAEHPVAVLEKQCGNGLQLLSNLKEVNVQSRVEVTDAEFFRYYDLTGIGGRIVVTPEELLTALDRKSGERSLIYLPEKGGRIYFSSFGKDGRTGRDIYTTQLLPDGRFEEPRKLAGYVNTDQDESFAAMAPDGKTLYFSSKGHNSMGGYDVFKCTYDQGSDVYGPPVNMDFAVNTPADDIFYMVDGEGGVACFASDRDSEYGKVNVYRVSTEQRPVIITVLKGTFADRIDPSDRDAHILVEDAVTHEQVADVKSDINGEYVLSLPRNGRYKFSVQAGRSGRTHVGMVEVPRSDAPHAYRQELTLVNDGGEKLVIRNYFDEPLPDDLIALALDEIKRRARLDVQQVQPVAEEPAPPEPVADAITAAGFTGDMTKEGLLRMAQDDARGLGGEAGDLKELSGAAYGEVVQQLSTAQQEALRAQDLVAQAEATTDTQRRNELMMAAAESRQRSRLAALQARAAFEAGNDLGLAADSVARRAAQAAALNKRLGEAWSGGNDAAVLDPLRELKARMDERDRPDAAIGQDERARREAVAAERRAAIALEQANAKRTEEDQLIDQVNRLRRERDAAKGAKKEQLQKQVTEYEGYRDAMHAEVEQAFSRSRELETRTAVARAQASITRQLTTNGGGAATELDPGQISALELKLNETDRSIAALPIDERYDAMVETAGTPLAQRTQFEWELADAATAAGDRANTEVVARDASVEAQRARQVGTQVTAEANDPRLAQGGAVPVVGVSGDAPVSEQRMAPVAGGQDTRPLDVRSGAVTSTDAIPSSAGRTDRTSTATLGGDTTGAGGAANELPLTPEAVATAEGAEGAITEAARIPPGERAFLAENELAETRQLRTAARTRTQRDSLDARMAALEQEIAALKAGDTAAAPMAAAEPPTEEARPMANVAPILFTPDMSEQELVDAMYSAYAADHQRIEAMSDPTERQLALNGLELMLVDSIAAQSQAQVDELDRHPERSPEILPRVDRLRQMKEAHQRAADEAAMAARAVPSTQAAGTDQQLLVSAQTGIPVPDASDMQELAERYVAIQPEGEYIYESKLEPRASTDVEAFAQHQRDIVELIAIEDRIDSLEDMLQRMPPGKDYDRLRDKADRAIDDRMILRAEMGQRSAFITKEEWKAGEDSLQAVRTRVLSLGLPPSEPMMVLARQMEDDARQRFEQAAVRRRKADRSEDIVERDSLLRSAYAMELGALRDLDRAITVNNYVLSEHFHKGDRPVYAELEAELFGLHVATSGIESDQSIFTGEPPVDPRSLATAEDRKQEEQARAELQEAAQGGPPPPAGAENIDPVTARAREIYRVSLQSDQAAATPFVMAEDPGFWRQRAEEARQAAARKEQESMLLADAASAARDSATVARKRERETIEVRARFIQLQADTLHMAALALNDSAVVYEQAMARAEGSRRFLENLRKFYYLSNEEEGMVIDDLDRSRYFMARTRALEARELAEEAAQRSTASRRLSAALLDEMQATMAPADGSAPAADAAARAARMNERAIALNALADSLDRASVRLLSTAELNERQASVILERMDPIASSELMALEQRARRTEPWLASAHSMVGEGIVDFEGMVREADRARAVSTAPARTAEPPVVQRQQEIEAPASTVAEPLAGATAERLRPTAESVPAPGGTAALASAYIAPPVLTTDVFELRDERVPVAIAIDAPKPGGIVYSVQVGAFRNPIPADLFGDMIPIMGESAGNGLTRYTVGLFDDLAAANKAKDMVRSHGYRDAFVVVYKDGRRISLTQARSEAMPPPPITAAAPVIAAPVEEGDARPVVNIVPPPRQAPAQTAGIPGDSSVLVKYPASAQEILASFEATPEASAYYNDPSAAPARQVETVKGLFFTVQVGVYSKPVALDRLFNITPLNSERTETGKIRYTTGVYLDMERARMRKDQSVGLGVKDAFVTAYLNGRRIPMNEARVLLARHGRSILADPAIETR